MFRKIAVAVHHADTDSHDALALGVTLARASGAELLLTSIWVSPLGPGDAIYDKALRGKAEREVALLRHAVPDDVSCETVIKGATSVLSGLHSVADARDVDLIVLGPSHLGRFARRLRGDLAVSALHDAPCAIVVAMPGQATRTTSLNDIVVAYDGSAESKIALDVAVDLAEETRAALRLVCVIQTPYAFSAEPYLGTSGQEHWLHAVLEEARSSLEDGRTRAAERVPTSVELREGHVHAELREAALTADLVVAGSRGFGALGRMLVGSTAGGLLRDHPCPVLVTPRGVGDRARARTTA